MQIRPYFVLIALVMSSASPARGGESDRPLPPGWERAPQPPFEVPAGALCPFSLRFEPVKDEVLTKVLSAWPDGSPRDQVYTGTLFGRFTNVDSGSSIVRNLSGNALVHWGEGGSSATWEYAGPVAVAFPLGGPLAPGMYVVDGLFVIEYAPDGTITLPVHHGTEENLCTTLGGQ
jgi:hypothetical protein